jgi:LysR family transcriptional activator of nhaA
MRWINYNHLYYFWMTARLGSVVAAAQEMMVSQPTVSIQIKELEASLEHRLFERVGRGLALTDAGRIAFNYANDMFALSQEMLGALEDQPTGRPLRLVVGVQDVIPKLLVRQLLQPALSLQRQVRLVCLEDKADRLLMELAARRCNVVLSDAPIATAIDLQGYNHLLAESDVSFFGNRRWAAKLRRGFPASLDGAPMLLPSDHTQMRRALNLWFQANDIHPKVVGEFDDSALLVNFAVAGEGVIPAPTIMSGSLRHQTPMQAIGRVPKVRERYYAISLEQQPKHPAVAAICAAAARIGSSAAKRR